MFQQQQQQQQKEDLIDRLDRILDWIKACDTKSSILLAISGLAITLFTSELLLKTWIEFFKYNMKHLTCLSILFFIILGLSLISFLGGIYFFIKELSPSLLSNTLKNKDTDSNYFFTAIANKDFETFKKNIKEKTLKDDIDDLTNEIYINATICHTKHLDTKRGIRYSVIGIIGVLTVFIYAIYIIY